MSVSQAFNDLNQWVMNHSEEINAALEKTSSPTLAQTPTLTQTSYESRICMMSDEDADTEEEIFFFGKKYNRHGGKFYLADSS